MTASPATSTAELALNAERAAKPGRYRGIQVLRIVAAFLVTIEHAIYYVRDRLDPTFPRGFNGHNGVDIFFVISGFVMVCSSVSLLGRSDGWKVFAKRRIARIVPMYWIATTIKLVLLLSTTGLILHARFSIAKTIESYLFLPSRNFQGALTPVLSVGWTLNFEMFFYLLFALALLFRANVYRFIGVILAMLAIGAAFRQPSWPPVSFYLNTIVLEFFFGMLVARACLAKKRLPRSLAVVFVVVGMLTLLIPFPVWHLPVALVTGVPATMIVFGVASLDDALTRIPLWLLFLGDASYSIYLFDPLVAPIAAAACVKFHLYYPVVAILAGIVLGLLAGCAAHILLERPINKWIRLRSNP